MTHAASKIAAVMNQNGMAMATSVPSDSHPNPPNLWASSSALSSAGACENIQRRGRLKEGGACSSLANKRDPRETPTTAMEFFVMGPIRTAPYIMLPIHQTMETMPAIEQIAIDVIHRRRRDRPMDGNCT
jgi:hypothetical protein